MKGYRHPVWRFLGMEIDWGVMTRRQYWAGIALGFWVLLMLVLLVADVVVR